MIVHEKKDRMGIKLRGLAELYGMKKAWLQLGYAEVKITELIKTAQGVIEANELKRSIFKNKLKKDQVAV